MKKIAILLSGEFRNFNVSKKTIPILEDSRVSVFVSTWNEVNTSFKKEIISEDIIKSYFQKLPANILIDSYEKGSSSPYFAAPMIDRWISGFKMIDDTYDIVLIMRPDLFFNPNHPITFEDIISCTGLIKFFNLKQHTINTLPDMGFCADYNLIKTVLSNLDQDWIEWNKNTVGWKRWHYWWFDYVSRYIESKKILT